MFFQQVDLTRIVKIFSCNNNSLNSLTKGMFVNQSKIYCDALILAQTSAIIILPFFFANCLIATVKFWSASFQLAAEIKTKTKNNNLCLPCSRNAF